jgi:hypothetical protein
LWGSACSSATAPRENSNCQRNDTGTLVLVNQGVTQNPRDAYMDGALVGTITYEREMTVTVAAGVRLTVQFVPTLSGGIVSSTQPIVNQCSTFVLTNES